MNTQDFKRKLTAVFSADVAGYSRLMGEDEVATVKTLEAYKQVMFTLIKQHRGRVIDSPGDNLLAEFASVVDAVQCGVAVQNELKARNADLPENRRMQFRIGINLGDVIEEQGRIYGDGVNIAARLEGLAEAEGICISGTAFDQVKNKVPVGYQYLGKQTVKNIPDPVRAYKVLMEAEAVGKVVGEEEPRKSKWGWKAAAAFTVLFLVAAGLVWNFYFRPPPIEPASKEKMAFPLPDRPSIAVLPFVNMSGDSGQEFLSDGITENIITGLSQLNALFVIARNSTFTYKGKPVKVQQVAENLGVRYVLEGSVQRSGERLRITAQFIDALKGHHLWSERYDRELKDLFAIEDDITKKILTALQVILTQGEQARLYAKGTENLDAYLKTMEAREQVFLFNKVANTAARQKAEEAISLDPGYSYAHGLLGKTYIGEVFFGWSPSPKEALGRAFESANKALVLDESTFQAHTTLAYVHLLKREHDAAVRESERAVELAPNAADSFFNLGVILRFAGRAKDAVAAFERAIRLNPIPPASYLYQLALSYTFVGDFEKAVRLCKEALSKNPDDLVGRVTLIVAYGSLGREEEARAQVSDLLRVDPKFSLEQAAKTWPYKKESDRELVLKALRKAGLPERPPLPLPDKPSIAVLPFENMSGDPEQEYFSDGLTEEIITALSKTPKLFVIARNSTFTYKGKPVKVQQVGRELGVTYVLEGSVRKAEDKVRITAQLVDAQTGHHLWAERYDRDLKDIFAIQDDITKQIITALQVVLTEGEHARITARGTGNLDAYLLYLQAVGKQMHFTKDGALLSRQLAEKAIALDSSYAAAYRILALSYWMEVPLGLTKDPRQSISKAMEFAQKSLALDKSSGGTYSLLGWLYTVMRQHDKGISECERGVALEPSSAWAHYYLGSAFRYAGRHEEAIKMYKEAIRLNPISPSIYYQGLANSYCLARQHEEAITAGRKAVNIEPNNQIALAFLAAAYSLGGQEEEAQRLAKEVLRVNPKFSLEYWAKQIPYKNPNDRELLISGLLKAGLK